MAAGVGRPERTAALPAIGPLPHARDQPLLSWAKKEGEPVDAETQLPQLTKRLVEVLSRDEITRMEHAAGTERDKLIIRLLADTGLGVGVLLGLRANDLWRRNATTTCTSG